MEADSSGKFSNSTETFEFEARQTYYIETVISEKISLGLVNHIITLQLVTESEALANIEKANEIFLDRKNIKTAREEIGLKVKEGKAQRLAELEMQRQEEENRALEENPDITFISPNTYKAEGKSLWNEQAALNDAKKKATNFCNRTGKILVYHSHYIQDTPIYGYAYMNFSCQ